MSLKRKKIKVEDSKFMGFTKPL